VATANPSVMIPKPTPRRLERQREKRRLQALRASLRDTLVQRDRRCRVCQCLLSEDAHAHHLRFRSQGGHDTMQNLVLLCPRCHAAIHARDLDLVPLDADQGADGELEARWRK